MSKESDRSSILDIKNILFSISSLTASRNLTVVD